MLGLLKRFFSVSSRSAPVRRETPSREQLPEERDDRDDGWRPARAAADPSWAALAWVPVRGISLQTPNAREFAAHARTIDARGERSCMEVEREPDNPHDPNAIRVIAIIGSRRLPLGYVPAESAARIAGQYPAAMPLAARLSRIRDDANLIGIDIDILRPSKRSAWWRSNVGT